MANPAVPIWPLEWVDIATLHAHKTNYQHHPQDELDHIAYSLEQHGAYRNVVVAADGTILAGHGVVEAAQLLGWQWLPVVRLPIDPDSREARQVLIGDNEIGRLAEENRQALVAVLSELAAYGPEALGGTGYDASMLAALAFVTRAPEDVADKNETAHWVGMPAYDNPEEPLKLTLYCTSELERDALIERLGVKVSGGNAGTVSAWWPAKEREDLSAYRFEG